MSKDHALVHYQIKAIQEEIERRKSQTIQNRHSYFLNARNPKPPIHERTQQILKERE